MRTKLNYVYKIIFSIALISSLSFNAYNSSKYFNKVDIPRNSVDTLKNGLKSYFAYKETVKYLRQLHSLDVTTNYPPVRFGVIDDSKATELARIFQPMPKHSWCVTKKNDIGSTSPCGLLYVRVPKTGSSTISSVTERLIRRHNCVGGSLHDWKERYKGRDKKKSFMMGSIRDPITRAMSRAFFGPISLRGREPSDKNILDALYDTREQYGCMTVGKGGYQLDYLSTNPIEPNSTWIKRDDEKILNLHYIEENVKQIMDSYDFITINERMDESLVALQFLLGLNITDILYMSSKIAGGFRISKQSCVRMQKSFISKNVSEFLSSQEWFEANYGDYLLHTTVNKSLDMTIQSIGQERFHSTLYHFKVLKKLATKQCSTNITLPCSNDGIYHEDNDCYYDDIGCGYQCLNTIVADYKVEQTVFTNTQNFLRTKTMESSGASNNGLITIEEKAKSIAKPFGSNVRLEALIKDEEKKNGTLFPLKRIYQIMVPETESRLIAGIVERIHNNHGVVRRFINKSIKDWKILYQQSQNFKTFFTLSSIRHPESRAINNAFKRISELGRSPSDDNVLKALQDKNHYYGSMSEGQGGYQLNYLTMQYQITINSSWVQHNGTDIFNYHHIQENVQSIFEHYDYIIVSERIEESLVALQLLLGLKISDILYFSTQLEEHQQKYIHKGRKCILQKKAFISDEVANFFKSKAWYEENYGDYLLHTSANKSLDLTIKKIGTETFNKALHEFRMIKKLANEECFEFKPCSDHGMFLEAHHHNCNHQQQGDSLLLYGCSNRCLDEFVSNISIALK